MTIEELAANMRDFAGSKLRAGISEITIEHMMNRMVSAAVKHEMAKIQNENELKEHEARKKFWAEEDAREKMIRETGMETCPHCGMLTPSAHKCLVCRKNI